MALVPITQDWLDYTRSEPHRHISPEPDNTCPAPGRKTRPTGRSFPSLGKTNQDRPADLAAVARAVATCSVDLDGQLRLIGNA